MVPFKSKPHPDLVRPIPVAAARHRQKQDMPLACLIDDGNWIGWAATVQTK